MSNVLDKIGSCIGDSASSIVVAAKRIISSATPPSASDIKSAKEKIDNSSSSSSSGSSSNSSSSGSGSSSSGSGSDSSSNPSSPKEGVAAAQASIETSVGKSFSNNVKTLGKHSGNQYAQGADSSLAKIHDVQDAKTDFGWTSMTHPDVLYTSLVALNDAKYSITEDYPTSRGEIDENGNFFKHNFTTGEWWDCHHTGFLRKVDGDGNYETKVPGTKLVYTFGDEGRVNSGNIDNLVMKNKYNHIMKDAKEIIDGNVYNNYNKNVYENIIKNQHEMIGAARAIIVGKNDDLTIGGNWTVNVGGNIALSAGGIIALKGAQILLN